jgi:hypothetical protein
MRYLLVLFQLMLLSVVGGALSVTIGMLYSPLGQVGNMYEAVGFAMLFAMYTVVAGMLVLIFLPLIVVTTTTLVCGLLAGYRPLRWLRWAGILVNGLGIVYATRVMATQPPHVAHWLMLAIVAVNFALFVLMPCRPDVALTWKALRVSHIAFWAILPVLALAATGGEHSALILVFSAIYFIPFHFNRKATVNFVRQPILRALIISAAFLTLWILLLPILAFPLALSLLALLAGFEMQLLYPESPGTVRLRLARYLSPAEPATATPRLLTDEMPEKDTPPDKESAE